MKKLALLICFGGLVALFLGSGWLGSVPAVNAQQGKKFRGRLPDYWKKLGLSKDQIQQVYAIQREYYARIQALQEQIKKLQDEERAKLLAILTESQKQRLREIYLKKAGLFDPSSSKKAQPKEP